MSAIEAGYHFAGIAGVNPRGFTLRQLWMMATGAERGHRKRNLELATLVWSLSEIDWQNYLLYGVMTQTGRGGPVQVSPEMQARIDAEVDRIRRENPNLPPCKTSD